MSSEFLASSWKKFRGRGILNHTPVLCGTVSWVKRFVVRLSTTKTTKILSHKKYPLYGMFTNWQIQINFLLCAALLKKALHVLEY